MCTIRIIVHRLHDILDMSPTLLSRSIRRSKHLKWSGNKVKYAGPITDYNDRIDSTIELFHMNDTSWAKRMSCN